MSRKRGRGRAEGSGVEVMTISAKVPYFRVAAIESRLRGMRVTARRAGLPFDYEVGPPTDSTMILFLKRGEPYPDSAAERLRRSQKVRASTIVVRGVMVPKIAGWEVVASLEPVEGTGQNILHVLDDAYAMMAAKYRKKVGVCDHCNVKRVRQKTFLLRNEATGEEKVVGRSCVADFLNLRDASVLLDQASFLEEISGAERDPASEDDERFGGVGEGAYVTSRVLFCAAFMVNRYGYTPKRAAEEGRMPTADMVSRLLSGNVSQSLAADYRLYRELLAGRGDAAERDRAWKLAEGARAFILKEAEQSEDNYIVNVSLLIGKEYTLERDIGMVVSAVGYFFGKERRRVEAELMKSSTRHIGTVGEKIYVPEAEIRSVVPIETAYGVSRIHTFTTPEGGVLIWFASSEDLTRRIGQKTSLIGTVKGHRQGRSGAEETVITRVAVDAAPPAPKKEVKKRTEEQKAAMNDKRALTAQKKAFELVKSALEMAIAEEWKWVGFMWQKKEFDGRTLMQVDAEEGVPYGAIYDAIRAKLDFKRIPPAQSQIIDAMIRPLFAKEVKTNYIGHDERLRPNALRDTFFGGAGQARGRRRGR